MSEFSFVVRPELGMGDGEVIGVPTITPSSDRHVRWMGAWDPATRYRAFDLVKHGGAGWIAARTSEGVTPIEGQDWELVLETDMDAFEVAYANAGYPELDSVGEALDKLLFVPLAIASFTGGGIFEKGQSIPEVSLAWVTSKAVDSLSIDGGVGVIDPSETSRVLAGPFTTDRTWMLTASKDEETASAQTSLRFRLRRFWGVSASPVLTDAQVLALSSELATTRTQSRTFDCSGGRYFYVAFPLSFGPASFKAGGLSFTAMTLETRDIVNTHGHVESYRIYRSTQLQNGSAIPVEVL